MTDREDSEYWIGTTSDVYGPASFIDLDQHNKAAEDYLKEWSKERAKNTIDKIEKAWENRMETGYKESEGKPDYSEINLNILDLMAERFSANKHKYPKGNMLKPLDKKELCWASLRHIKKMIKPPTDDPETFEQHLAATLCNMSMVLDQLEIEERNKLIDSITR